MTPRALRTLVGPDPSPAVRAFLAAREGEGVSDVADVPRGRPRRSSHNGGLSAGALPPAPVTFRLAFSALVPDNARLGVLKGRALLTARYRRAKVAASHALAAQWAHAGHRAPWAGLAALDVCVTPPDRRRRDVTNYAKLLGDALQAARVLVDDAQLVDVRFRRLAPDPAAPGAVLTLTAL